MPYLRGDYYYSRPVIMGVRYGPWSLGTRDKRLAAAVEQAIKDLPLTCPQLLPHLASGRISPVDVRAASLEGKLLELAAKVTRRPLEVVVEEYRAACRDNRKRQACDRLPRLIQEERVERGEKGEITIAWLEDPRNVRAILLRREREGVKHNSVIRSDKGAISDILQHEGLDPSPIMRKVQFKTERDRRNVQLSPEQIGMLLDGCVEEEFRHIVALAVTTAMDRAPILRIQPEDFTDPMLVVRDTKTAHRARKIELGELACTVIRTAIARSNAKPGQRIFSLSASQVEKRWFVLRKQIGMPKLRFKDLRGVAASYIAATGATARELQGIMGHSNPKQSIEYTSVIRSGGALSEAEKLMGLRRLA